MAPRTSFPVKKEEAAWPSVTQPQRSFRVTSSVLYGSQQSQTHWIQVEERERERPHLLMGGKSKKIAAMLLKLSSYLPHKRSPATERQIAVFRSTGKVGTRKRLQ